MLSKLINADMSIITTERIQMHLKLCKITK